MVDFPSFFVLQLALDWSKAKPNCGGRKSCPPPLIKGNCWMLFCLVIFTVRVWCLKDRPTRPGWPRHALLGLLGQVDARTLCDIYFEGIAAAAYSQERIRREKQSKSFRAMVRQCVWAVFLSFIWFLICQTSGLCAYLQGDSISQSNFILLMGRAPTVFWV